LFFFFFSYNIARNHEYGRQRNDRYNDDYNDDYYSYDNSAAMSFSGFGGVSYNPGDDESDSESDYSESESESGEESDEEELSEKKSDDNEEAEITNGIESLAT